MAIPSETRRAGPFQGNGVQTQFEFEFKIFDPSEVRVMVSTDEGLSESELDSDAYSCVLNDDQDTTPGGTVTLNAALAVGSTMSILSAVPYAQTMVLTNRGGFYPDILNESADRAVILAQQLLETVERTMKVPSTSEETPEDVVERLMAAQEDARVQADAAAASAAAAAESAALAEQYNNAAQVIKDHLTDVSAVADAIEDVSAVALDLTDVKTVVGIKEDVQTTAAISDDVETVAGMSLQVASVGQNISQVVDVAVNLDDINVVAGDMVAVCTPDGDNYGSLGEQQTTTCTNGDGTIKTVADAIEDIELLAQYGRDGTLEAAATSAESAAASATQATSAAQTAEAAKTAAQTAQTGAETARDLAEDWATKTDGTVDGTDYSAKYYAQQAGTTVDASLQQIETAKTQAVQAVSSQGTTSTGAVTAEGTKQVGLVNAAGAAKVAEMNASTNLAEAWATKTDGAVEGSEYSAKYHAQAAASSATTAGTHRTKAEEAQAAAEGAQTAAESAKSAAETAKTGAEAAKAAAEAAQQAAEEAAAQVGDPLGKDEAAATYATKNQLTTGLNGKANASHTHTTAQVDGLDAALSGKAPASHTHAMSQVDGLDEALAGKAAVSHTHALSQVSGTGTLAGKSTITIAEVDAAGINFGAIA